MGPNQPNWVKHPTKKHLIILSAIWLAGMSLSLAAATDLYTTSPFVSKNTVVFFLWIGATVALLWVVANFFRSRKSY
ncbi:MAG: hypothetical protein WKF88_04705 [Ferruginibacter sp.]